MSKQITRTRRKHMDLQALLEGYIDTVISLITPRDAGTLASVSRSFRSAADSDAVWGRFLPPDIHTILSSSSPSMSVQPPHVAPSSASKTKKEFYLALCDNPVLIEQGKLSFSLDKWSGKKCYMMAARALSIIWADTPQYWNWISIPDSRFEEVAELVDVCWLEIHGRIETRMLSPSTLYKAYLVFKTTAQAYGFEAQYPKERNDGWLEIEMGEFFCEGGEGGELEMSCLETKGRHWKSGLIVQGIEIRPKRM